MPLVEIAGLQPRNDMPCRAPLFKKARGRPQVARLTAGERPILPTSTMSEGSAMQSGIFRPVVQGNHNSAASFSALGEVIFIRVDVTRLGIPENMPASRNSNNDPGLGSDDASVRAEGEDHRYQLRPCILLRYNFSSDATARWSVHVVVCTFYGGDRTVVDTNPDLHIPLPPLLGHPVLPIPPAFGDALQVSLVPRKQMWAVATLRNVEMGGNGSVSRALIQFPERFSTGGGLSLGCFCGAVPLRRQGLFF